jgi:hypothetical protein
MFSSSFVRRTRRRAASVVAVLVLAGLVGRERPTLRAQTVGSKLTTLLAAVTTVVRQDAPSTTPAPAASTTAVDVTTLPKSVQDAIKGRTMRLDAAGHVQVYVLVSDVSVGALQQLASAGATVQVFDAPHQRVQAMIPLTRLQAVAALPFVNFIRLPSYAFHRETESEGDAIIQATAARAQYGLDGTGVNVGVISDGLKGVFATACTTCNGVSGGPISTGDLPTSTGTRTASGMLTASSGGITGKSFTSNNDLEGLIPGCAFAGAGAEGTALLEIVHDVAPKAQLAFANADTDLDFNQAVNFLASSNDVVVDDLGFFDVPFDGTNLVSANTAAALNNNGNRIRTYITANGNDANDNYFGAYVDSGVDGTTITGVLNPGHLQLFQASSTTADVLGLGPQPFNEISLPAGGQVDIFLQWNDPAGASTNNYDLYLVQQSNNTVVASSTDVQNGSEDPQEFIQFTNNGAAGLFRMVVQNVRNQAAPRNLSLVSFQDECAQTGPLLLVNGNPDLQSYNTASSSVIAESDAGGSPVSVISAGAICSASAAAQASFAGAGAPDLSCSDASHSTIEFFSSQGPTWDGRVKPDIAGIDGVSVSGAGQFEVPFFGTSAAGPHIAGEAALVIQAAACLQSTADFPLDAVTARTKLRNILLSTATPRSQSPPDNIFGAGLANALKAVQATLPALSGSASVVVSGNAANGARLSASQIGFVDPDGCPITRLSWTGGCGTSPDTVLTCPIGTTNVSVAASNSGTAFSAPTNVQITVTGFSVAAATPSVSVQPGQSAQYQLTITPVGGPFANAIQLGCSGLPQGAACAFNPATVTPGATSAQSVLTITTTAPAQTSVARRSAAIAAGLAARSASDRSWLFLALLAMMVAAGWAFVVRNGAMSELANLLRQLAGNRRRRLVVGVMSATLVAFGLQIACGSSNGNNSTSTTVSLSPTSLTFASQSTGTPSPAQAITVLNTGTSALTVSGVAASGDFSATNTCGTTLSKGTTCTILVTFTPTAAGNRTGTLTITDSAGNSPQTVALSGVGVSSSGTTPAGSFQVTVNGSFGAFVQSGAITLNVQ